MGLFDSLRRKRHTAAIANDLYLKTVEQSRSPGFYTELGVPDTVDGRFDMIILHIMLVVRRLRGQSKEAVAVSQEILNLMFADMDRNFREMGIGDMSIGKHVKKVAKAFYGRAEILEAGLESNHGALVEALINTIYRSVDEPHPYAETMATYVADTDTILTGQALSDLVSGQLDFSPDSTATSHAV